MNLSFPKLPAAVAQAIDRPFQAPDGVLFQPAHAVGAKSLTEAFGGAPAVLPHKEFTIPMDGLLGGGNPLDAARDRGWRSLEFANNGIGGARLFSSDKATEAKVLQFNVGPFAAGTARTMRMLQATATAGTYEFRFLVLPQIYVAAVWLHGPDDQFVALAPAPREMPVNTLLPATTFFELVRALAASARDFDSSKPQG